jgi:hypothetical protein
MDNSSRLQAAAASIVADDASSAAGYLTDGINLYRYLGLIANGNLHGLEDCRTLEVTLLTNSDLDALPLCPVIATNND